MESSILKDKRVLFIGMGFYDYDDAIISQFKKFGALTVDYFSEVPNSFAFRYALRTKNEKRKQSIIDDLCLDIARKSGSSYDIIFVIKGEYLTQESIDIIKSKSKSAQWILYLWDSIERIPGSSRIFNRFDKIYSFDRLECLKYPNLNFNPLFYREEYNQKEVIKNASTDLYFLGWYHSDRLRLIKKLSSFCDDNNLKYNMKLYGGLFSYLLHTVNGGELKGNKKLLTFSTVSAKENMMGILSAKCSLDIAHPQQNGLTMRTIELLGAKKKIITTNHDIVNYDFYDENNVLIINRESPKLQKDFFDTPYVKLNPDISSQYSISNWLYKMISN